MRGQYLARIRRSSNWNDALESQRDRLRLQPYPLLCESHMILRTALHVLAWRQQLNSTTWPEQDTKEIEEEVRDHQVASLNDYNLNRVGTSVTDHSRSLRSRKVSVNSRGDQLKSKQSF